MHHKNLPTCTTKNATCTTKSMATVNLFFDTRATAQNEGIIKIAVTHNRVKRLYTTGIKITPDQWKELPKKGEKLDGKVKDETRRKLYADIYAKPNGYYRRAETIAEAMGVNFNFDKFKQRFEDWGKIEVRTDDNLFAAFESEAKSLELKDRVGTAQQYGLASRSFARFVSSLSKADRKELGLPLNPSDTVRFEHITVDFLDHYANWSEHFGKQYIDRQKRPIGKPQPASTATTNSYLRSLRAIYNKAIRSGIVEANKSPFVSDDYEMPSSDIRRKKGFDKATMIQIINHQCTNTIEQRSRDLFAFSYVSKGMNFDDVLRLKWANIDRANNTFSFQRQKTKNTKKKKELVEITMIDLHWKIIEQWGNADKRPTAYIFDVLNDTMTAKGKKDARQQFIRVTNKWLQRIADGLGIDAKISTVDARYSYITEMSKNVTTIADLKAATGHSSSVVALGYARTDKAKQRQMTESLMQEVPKTNKEQLLSQLAAIQAELAKL